MTLATRQPGHEAARLLLAVCLVGAAWICAQAEPASPPDAVIELWEQHWTLGADGSTVYYNKQFVRLNNDRSFGEFADPRLTYDVATDKLEIMHARVKLADGSYRELPDYSHVLVTPDATSGWPSFANIRQHLLVMSGIEPGCVVELEYQITSAPGARSGWAADVRLDHRYPVTERVVGLTAPSGVKVSPAFTGLSDEQRRQIEPTDPANKAATPTRRWTLHNLPAGPDEPQAAPWQARGARFLFSTAGTAEQWLSDTVERLDAAARESELVAKLAEEWNKDALEPSDRLRAIQEKLAASFNFVEFDPSWRPASLRPAGELLRSDYGTPEEAAALLAALARAVGLPVRFGVLVNDEVWSDAAPQRATVAAYVVLLDTGSQPEAWEPHHGRVVRDARWAGHTLLCLTDGHLQRTGLPSWGAPDESRIAMTGTVTVGEDGNLAGTVFIRTTGLFVAPESLRAADAQKSRVNALVGRLLPDVSVESFTVKVLAAGEFAAEAKVKSSKALKKLDVGYWLRLPQDGPFLADVPLPLAYGERKLPVRLAGAFDEQLELNVEWPKSWKLQVQPCDVGPVSAEGGKVEQHVSVEQNRLTLARHTAITQRELPAAGFLALRAPLNELRSDPARTLLLQP